MAIVKSWLGLCLFASCVGVIVSQTCPNNWRKFGNSCYLFVLPTLKVPHMSWEESRANCVGFGGDLVSILNSSEVDYIYNQTSVMGNFIFWIGLYRNKTTGDPNEGWIWSDGNNFTNPQQWAYKEPNDFQNNEKCAEFYGGNKLWNDNDCAKPFASICKRKLGLPDPTIATSGTFAPTKDPPPTCDYGWVAHNRSCYWFSENSKNWDGAKKACRDTGGHLVRIDSVDEQNFLTYKVRPTRKFYWIGLNDLEVAGRWVWEFNSTVPLKYNNWQSGEPNGLGVERCVEMYGFVQAGFWNDASCNGWKAYVCEKEEGRNMCPEGWIPYNDTCYQFNMDFSQKKTWAEAAAACNAIVTEKFGSLLKITSQSEQDFITKRIQLISPLEVWIGLNDLKNENVFRWSDNSELVDTKYQVWANGKPSENKENSDCVMILGVRNDGAWSVQDCSLKRNFVCMRHRDLPVCNAPLGMETGKIQDFQITASSSLSASNGPDQARLRNNGAWCPATASSNEYLQVELPYLADIRKIVSEGNVTQYKLRISRDGKTFKNYASTLIPKSKSSYVETKSLIAKVVQIYPNRWNNYPCLRLEFIGCPAQDVTSIECSGNNWKKGPGNLCYQINRNYRNWEDARSVCLDQGGDLLTITTEEEKKYISNLMTGYNYFWISLNDRDYRNYNYWSNNDANGIINWGSGAPDETGSTNSKACVAMKSTNSGGYWKDFDCYNRWPFICTKGDPFIRKHFAQTGATGMWMSSATYYWPLSAIDNNMILGTRLGKVNGKVTPTTGVSEKPNSALQFSSEGSYIDLGKFEKECFTSPDYCSNGLTLSFMASFDQNAVIWSKRVNILDSAKDETNSLGLSVYIQSQNLWFVVSKTSKYIKTFVPIVANEWRHYVMRWNDSSEILVTVNGQDVSTTSATKSDISQNNPAKNFLIGLQQSSGVTSGQVSLAMVAFWNKTISNDDISLIYKAEFGTCPFSWFEYGMSCYQFNEERKSSYDAKGQCQSLGGDLIDINSNVEQSFITTRVQTDQTWIGAHDKGTEGIFETTNDEVIPYSNWNHREPNNYWSREDCVEIRNGGVWNDMPCYYSLPYICKKQKDVKVGPTNITTTIAPVRSFTKLQYGCQYTRFTIGCPSGLVINVNSAFWGRRLKNRCTFISVISCGVKDIPTVTKSLKKKCDHYASCDLHASQAESYLDDPCPSIDKYLEVNYTCVKDTLVKKCKPGWNNYKGSCYRLFDTPRTWTDANSTCNNFPQVGAELLSINGNFEQSFATSLMARAWYTNVWIGLNDLKVKGVYEWSDKTSVTWTNWYFGQPDERRIDKSCAFMSLTRSKRGWMYWSDQNCTTKYPFMCKYTIAGSTTQKPTTVPTVYTGCNKGWKTNKSLVNCYYYRSNNYGSKWENARSFCQGKGADLVSIQSIEENEFVMKMWNNSLTSVWIGLEAKGVFRGHVWSDGQPVRYTNWEIGQPDSYNGLESCVAMNPDTGLWSDRNCNDYKQVVCMKRKGIAPVTKAPVIYPTPGSSLCKKGWTLFQGMCYIVGNDTADDYWTWYDAEKKCQSLSGHLVSINRKEEQNFIKFIVKNRVTRDHWIGLNDLGTEGVYKWSDNSRYNYANWNRREPNDYNRQEDCVHLINTRERQWNDQHCQYKYSYICKAYNESYKPPIKPTPPPRPQDDGYCPSGWIAHAQYCYQFHSSPSEYKNWNDARDACEQGHNSSDYGELVSIHDEFEEAFITIHIKGAKQWLWTGMNKKHNAYLWVDNTVANYFKWNTREPSSWYGGLCVEIVPYHWAAGRWNAVWCSKLNGYICKKAASNKPVTPTPKVTESKCREGYKSYDKSCFKFVSTRKTFDGAREVCQKHDGDLMVVDNQFKQAYLIYLLERYIGNVWIGFHHEPYSVFKFVDHSSPIYTYWGTGQPSRQLNQKSCTQANVTGSNFGVWDDVECSTTNSFVCEIYKGEPKVTVLINGTCPDGWRHYDKHCYQHSIYPKAWAAAQYDCSSKGAHLVSIHDEREQDFLIHYYQNIHPIKIWTGLNDVALERGYRWIDNSPLDYINWAAGEPNDHHGNENCVEMQTRSGQWNDMSCRTYRPYMCKKKLECSSVIPLDSSMVTVTDTYNASTFGADKAILSDQTIRESTSWCTNNTSGTAKIMIDFNQLVRVTGISVMGRSAQINQYVKSFRIDYERDENWQTYHPGGYQTTIEGNRWTFRIVTRTFKHPFAADGLTITPVTWHGDLVCMKIRIHGCPYVCQRQLFLGHPSRIGDNVIKASSWKYPNEPKQTGIRGRAWCSETNDKKQWIKFSFDKEMRVSTIRTFGDKKNSYVKTYSLQFSEDGIVWTDYKQQGRITIFKGNNEAFNPMRHDLVNQIESFNIRLIPITWNNNICMRISLLGCEADCSKPLLATGRPSYNKYSSSDENSHPEYALFDTGKAWCTKKTPLAEQYLEIKLKGQYRLYKIGTKPSPVNYQEGAGQVLTFTLKQRKGKNWYYLGAKGQPKVFVAVNEEDSSQPKINLLVDHYRQGRDGFKTPAIRIYPKDFKGTTICMRVELYGCPAGVEIIPTTQSTAQDVVQVSVRFTGIEWNDKLSDSESKEFGATSKNITVAIQSVYSASESFRSAEVLKLSKGSVIAKIKLVFNPEFADRDNVTSLLKTAVENGRVGRLKVDKESFKVVGEKTQASKGDVSDSLSGGAVAGVVITVLILVAVALGVAFFFYRRKQRKNLFSPQHFDNPISYSSKAYDMDN